MKMDNEPGTSVVEDFIAERAEALEEEGWTEAEIAEALGAADEGEETDYEIPY